MNDEDDDWELFDLGEGEVVVKAAKKKKSWCVKFLMKSKKISKCGWFDMPLRSTFEIGTQIILLKIDGFLQRLDFKYHPS